MTHLRLEVRSSMQQQASFSKARKKIVLCQTCKHTHTHPLADELRNNLDML